jgi:hypothetical protein
MRGVARIPDRVPPHSCQPKVLLALLMISFSNPSVLVQSCFVLSLSVFLIIAAIVTSLLDSLVPILERITVAYV